MVSDTSTSNALKRAREEYLKDPTPSSSKAEIKSPFKRPMIKVTRLDVSKTSKPSEKSDDEDQGIINNFLLYLVL